MRRGKKEVSCVPCTHRQVSPRGQHPFVEGHRGFRKAGRPHGDEAGSESTLKEIHGGDRAHRTGPGWGEPRNAPSSSVHYFLTRDGTPSEELLRIGRKQLGAYPSVELWGEEATGAAGSDGEFRVVLEGGSAVGARKILLATGRPRRVPVEAGLPGAVGARDLSLSLLPRMGGARQAARCPGQD